MNTILHTTILESVECCECGMAVGLSASWLKSARDAGGFTQQFWCPYCGTRQGWGKGRHQKELDALHEERDRLARNLEDQVKRKLDAQAEAEHFRRSRDATRGVLSKVKKRVGKGTCPCCNRHFENLRRHMETNHPTMATEGVNT